MHELRLSWGRVGARPPREVLPLPLPLTPGEESANALIDQYCVTCTADVATGSTANGSGAAEGITSGAPYASTATGSGAAGSSRGDTQRNQQAEPFGLVILARVDQP